MSARTLLVIGDAVDDAPAADERPVRDHEALARRLGADVVHAGELRRRGGRTRDGIALARRAAARASDYDSIYCDSEHIGLPLAFLLGRRPAQPRLTMIGHYMSPLKKRAPVRLLRLHRHIDVVAVHSPAQAARMRRLGFGAVQVAQVPYQVDAAFWRPRPEAPGRHIASAGQEFRDYLTLLRAADGLPAQVRIAAGSHWSRRRANFAGRDIPANVTIGRLPYRDLREMYAGARFAVVPLHDVDFQAGIITILEAMAMGKCVIVSRTRGQTGVVSGPLMDRGVMRDIGERAWPEDTGIYVPPGDVASLREAMAYLLARPDVARRMGAAARRHVEAGLSLGHFVERMATIVEPATTEAKLVHV